MAEHLLQPVEFRNDVNHGNEYILLIIWSVAMKIVKLGDTTEFTPGAMKRFFLVEDSAFFKIINFNMDAGVTFPIHSHDLDGDLSIQVLEGEGFFLGEGGAEIPAKAGDILISQIREPHGVRAGSNMRILVTIAPPI